MIQHHIQEAYLKNFCEKGKLWVYDTTTKISSPKPASQCTVEEDFQSEYLEKLQNDTFESPGIKVLRKLVEGKNISTSEYISARYWTALHALRNKKYKAILGQQYESEFDKLIEIEKIVSEYFRFCFILNVYDEKYLITSDNPVVEFTVGNDIARILTLSPKKMLLLSHVDKTISHNEIELTELINSILWANAFSQVYSNQNALPISIYEENIVKYQLKARLEINQFIIRNKN